MIAETFPLEEDPAALGDEKWNTTEVAFLMGLYAAEGCLAWRYGREGSCYEEPEKIVYVTSIEETATHTEVVRCAEKLGHKVTPSPEQETHSTRIEIGFKELAKLCSTHIGSPAIDKRLSDAILHMPRDWQRVFFSAYSGGAGCVSHTKKDAGAVRCVSASVGLLRDTRLLLARLGLVASVNGRHNTKATWYSGKPIYELYIGHSQFDGTGSAKSYLHPDGYILSAVAEVRTYTWQGSVHDLTVAEDKSFVVNGVAVHNSNINGDYFPEVALIHKGPDYGYETFRTAGLFKHHVNKDITRSFGNIMLSAWHDHMKRVELVIEVDRDKALQFGATDVCDKLDQGIYPDVSMGCLPKGSPVFRADGRRVPIEAIKEGDIVLTHKGRPRLVTSTMVRPHKGPIYHVKAYGHRDALMLTEEHPLWLVRKEQMICHPSSKTVNKGRKQRICTPNSASTKVGCAECSTLPKYRFEWVRTDEVCEGDYLALPIPNYRTDVKFTTDQARLLGYYLSEGLVLRTNAGNPMAVQFCTNLLETETHEELYQLGERLGLNVTEEYDVEDRNGKYISIWDRSLAELCAQHCGEKALTKRLSSDLIGADVETLQLLLGAYANVDGGCYKGSLYFSTASEELSEQLRLVLARCGMIASVNEIVHKPSKIVLKETIEFQVWVGTDTAWKLTTSRHSVGKSDRLCSKRFFYTYDGVTYLMTPIESVEEVSYDDDVYNFSVDEDESYLVEGLAVHNCKVPYDLCSNCTDWRRYEEAKATFDQVNHKSISAAVLEVHKKYPIRGLSITRNDYCEHLRKALNKIMPNGLKNYAINDYPRFFDISVVFIGADKTAKVMAKLASVSSFSHVAGDAIPSWQVAEVMGYSTEEPMEKAASVGHVLPNIKAAAEIKSGEIEKDVVPSQFGGKAVPAKDDIPNDILDTLGKGDLSEALSTPTMMGMLLRPREFQRITIISMGNKPLADELDNKGIVFPHTDEDESPADIGSGHFSDMIKKLLMPLMEGRSSLEPVAKRRMIKITIMGGPKEESSLQKTSSHPFMQKIAAMYNGYIRGAISCLKDIPSTVDSDSGLWSAIYGKGIGDSMFKLADGAQPAHVLGAAIVAEAISVMARRDVKRQELQGQQAGLIEDLIASHPHALASLAALGALHAEGSSLPKDLLAKLVGIGKNVISR